MSKFLKLVEENTPGEVGVGPFTVEYKDASGKVMATVTLARDTGAAYDNFLRFSDNNNGVLDVPKERVPEEDDSTISTGGGTYDVGNAVRRLAAKASSGLAGVGGKLLGRKAQQAKAAVKRRDKVDKQVIPIFNAETDEYEKAAAEFKRGVR